ncbi:MAG: class I SAM-dependent methyltransferase [Alphaproteobacteria bacterium]
MTFESSSYSADYAPSRRLWWARGKTGWVVALEAALARVQVGTITLTCPDGITHKFVGEDNGMVAHLQLRDPRAARALFVGGTNGFAEAYLAGWWDTPDLTALLGLAAANEQSFALEGRGAASIRALRRLQHLRRANSKRGSKRNISYHYDLGNDFYAAWLDPSMTYSSALYDDAETSLADGQLAKYKSICQALDLKPGDHLLEIGCGWGGLCEVAARDFGAKVTAITLSAEQLAYARKRMEKAGLADQVEIKFCDYRDLTGSYDAVASIEMIEAVGEKYLPSYFEVLNKVSKPGGGIVVQAITIAPDRYEEYRSAADFVQRHVFPGGFLPTVEVLSATASAAGLAITNTHLFGPSYARTLAAWHRRFENAWNDIAPQGFDERFRRLWRFYLSYCEVGFETGRTNVGHYTFQKPSLGEA